ncbi:MAG: hypothetical protein LBN37_08085 [Bacteroidales bacterium]|jgi:hypothetical protein|nr:hypothetical protein [Bacteroidales bacterium]
MKKVVFLVAVAILTFSAAQAQDKRYGVESLILKKSSTAMGQTMSSIQYIADWGNQESTETFVNVQGQMLTVFAMIKDGYMYSANLAVKQGTKINLAAMDDYKSVNYLKLTDEVKKKYNIEEKGSEQFLEKDCKKYTLSMTMQGQSMNATIWVWQGLALKSVMTVMGNVVTEETTEIIEGKKIPKDKFELPEGVTFTEINPQGN